MPEKDKTKKAVDPPPEPSRKPKSMSEILSKRGAPPAGGRLAAKESTASPEVLEAMRRGKKAPGEPGGQPEAPPRPAPTRQFELGTPEPMPEPKEGAEPGAAPAGASSYQPEQIAEKKKEAQLRQKKTAAKKEKKAATAKGKKAGAGLGSAGKASKGIPAPGGKPGKGVTGIAGKKGGAISQTIALLKKIAKVILRVIVFIAPFTCCNPCCWLITALILMGIMIAYFLGLINF